MLHSCPWPLGRAGTTRSTLALLEGQPLLAMGPVCPMQPFFYKCKFMCEVSLFTIEVIPLFFIKDGWTRHLAGWRCCVTSPGQAPLV